MYKYLKTVNFVNTKIIMFKITPFYPQNIADEYDIKLP